MPFVFSGWCSTILDPNNIDAVDTQPFGQGSTNSLNGQRQSEHIDRLYLHTLKFKFSPHRSQFRLQFIHPNILFMNDFQNFVDLAIQLEHLFIRGSFGLRKGLFLVPELLFLVGQLQL